MSFKHGIMDMTLRENFGDRVTHGFADAQLALRAAGMFCLLMMTWHERHLSIVVMHPRLRGASTSFSKIINELYDVDGRNKFAAHDDYPN